MKRRDVNECVQENAMALKNSWHENYLHLQISLSEFLLPPATPSIYFFSLPLTCRSVLFPLSPPDDSQLEGATLFPVLVHSPISPLSSGVLEPHFKHKLCYSGQWVPVAQEKLVLIETEHQEPGTTMTVKIFLLPCSPNFSQHFSQANRNLLLLFLFPSLMFMHEEIIWMKAHPSHLPWAPPPWWRSGSLSLLWHFSHQRMHSLSFSFPKRWRWVELHAALSPPRPGRSPPLPAAGKVICNANPRSFQLRNNTFLLPQLQLHITEHTRDYPPSALHSDIHTHVFCSMLLSPPFPHQIICFLF